MNINKKVENHGKKNISIFVLIDIKTEFKEDIVFLMGAKTQILNAPPKRGFLKMINVVFN